MRQWFFSDHSCDVLASGCRCCQVTVLGMGRFCAIRTIMCKTRAHKCRCPTVLHEADWRAAQVTQICDGVRTHFHFQARRGGEEEAEEEAEEMGGRQECARVSSCSIGVIVKQCLRMFLSFAVFNTANFLRFRTFFLVADAFLLRFSSRYWAFFQSPPRNPTPER